MIKFFPSTTIYWYSWIQIKRVFFIIQAFSQFQNITVSMRKYFLGNSKCTSSYYMITHLKCCNHSKGNYDVIIRIVAFLPSRKIAFLQWESILNKSRWVRIFREMIGQEITYHVFRILYAMSAFHLNNGNQTLFISHYKLPDKITSWHGTALCIAGLLWGESIGHRRISPTPHPTTPAQKGSGGAGMKNSFVCCCS